MNAQRKFVTSLLLLVLLFTEACNKKQAAVPPHAQAPTLAVKLPDEIPEENAEAAPAPEVAEVPVAPPPVKTKPKKPARAPAKKTTPPAAVSATVASTPPVATNNQTVATLHPPHNGSENTPDMAIAVAMPSAQVVQQKEDTAHMIDATENALKNINRSLTDEEKAMRTQIQSYLQQSRKATADGDFERAFNLAKKAQLLAEALTKK